MELNPPEAVRWITRRLEDAGHPTWAVGGAVRDAVLGLPAGDWDLATRARPEAVRRLFRRTVPLGVEHGTVGVLAGDDVLYEVTTFRRDVETDGRHATVVFADTVEEDLARRDFTCNALAWHALTGELRDPWSGREDLERGVLRTVGEPADRFAEDDLRVLRALRFAGHFGWEIEPATWRALREATARLPRLSAERIREELWKVLEKTRASARTLALYAEAGVLAVLYPELDEVAALDDGDGTAPDSWTITSRAVDAVSPARLRVRLAALLHATGKPAARTRDLRGGFRYTGYEVLSARRAEDVMARLKASNADTERVTRLVRLHNELFPPDAPGRTVRRWLRHVGVDLVRDLFRLRFALWRAAPGDEDRPEDLLERWAMTRAVLRSDPPLEVKDLAIGGDELKELGIEPGPVYGRILDGLLERVLDDPELNRPDTLLDLVREEGFVE